MKKDNFEKLAVDEIAVKIRELKTTLSRLSLGKARSESKDVSVFGKTRRTIARLYTELNARKG